MKIKVGDYVTHYRNAHGRVIGRYKGFLFVLLGNPSSVYGDKEYKKLVYCHLGNDCYMWLPKYILVDSLYTFEIASTYPRKIKLENKHLNDVHVMSVLAKFGGSKKAPAPTNKKYDNWAENFYERLVMGYYDNSKVIKPFYNAMKKLYYY